jgi:hypothetical protein
MEMGLVAGRNLDRTAINLGEALFRKPGPDGGDDTPSPQKERPPVSMDIGAPPGQIRAQIGELRQGLAYVGAAAKTPPNLTIQIIIQ